MSIIGLHEAREKVLDLKHTAETLEQMIADSDIGKELAEVRGWLKDAQQTQARMENEVREWAITAFLTTGDKKPHPAVQIKEYTVLTYDDGQALTYSREHIPNAVKLDKRAFEKAAAALALDFVQIATEPRATIATDLSKYLE